MKSNYVARAKKFLEQVYPYIKDCEDEWDLDKALRKFNQDYHRKVQTNSGSTRVVMITSDYVIKYDYDGWGKGTWGTCKDEVRMYRKAKRDGYAHLFAEITPVRANYNKTFYIMPRINGVGRYEDDAIEYVDGNEFMYLYHNVNDLHNGNYGWKDKHIVMIDYASNSTMWVR